VTPNSTQIRQSSNYTTTHEVKDLTASLIDALNGVLLGKDTQVRLALACLLARGHLLIEDLPGMGKTLLSHALAKVLGLTYNRIQFTSDVLPADIIGVSVFEPEGGQFRFHRGPVFSQLVLADEVNRATPKAQSALLEAMEEHQVTADGQTYPLTEPFFVIATQNPLYQVGTFPLPESQLDRFLMRIDLGYPEPALERQLLLGRDRRDLLATMAPALTPQQLLRLQGTVPRVHASDALLDYVQAIACRLGGDHCPDIRVHLVRTPLFNASMAPNGMMQVWTGLMLRWNARSKTRGIRVVMIYPLILLTNCSYWLQSLRKKPRSTKNVRWWPACSRGACKRA